MKSFIMIAALGLFTISSCDTMRSATGTQDNGVAGYGSNNTRNGTQAQVSSEKTDFRPGRSTEVIQPDADTAGRIRSLSNTETK